MESIPSASYSFTLRVEFPHQAGSLGKILTVVGEVGALVGAVDIVRIGEKRTIRDITVNARDSEHGQQVVKAVDELPDVKVINVSDRTFLVHLGGKIEVRSKMQLRTRDDLSAPRCFEIEDRLKQELEVPVFHDDQHGTAVVVLAALINALKITGKRMEDLRVVVNGIGAAGVACAKILFAAGGRSIIGCDSRGIVHEGREGLNAAKLWFAEDTNREGRTGGLAEAIRGADLFLGPSVPGVLAVEYLESMAEDPIVFAMANPDPEIRPEVAMGRARIIATGRSDYPNQINNVLCFPGIFRGALDVRAREITEEMKMAAARGIASIVGDDELREDYIIPSVFDERVAPAVAEAVANRAKETGMARRIQERAETGLT